MIYCGRLDHLHFTTTQTDSGASADADWGEYQLAAVIATEAERDGVCPAISFMVELDLAARLIFRHPLLTSCQELAQVGLNSKDSLRMSLPQDRRVPK